MQKSKIILWGLVDALGVAIYVVTVAFIMTNGSKVFGSTPSVLVPTVILMLLVLSVAMVGSLIFGRPTFMYFEGMKKEAVKLVICTLSWLMIFTVLIIFVLLLIK